MRLKSGRRRSRHHVSELSLDFGQRSAVLSRNVLLKQNVLLIKFQISTIELKKKKGGGSFVNKVKMSRTFST